MDGGTPFKFRVVLQQAKDWWIASGVDYNFVGQGTSIDEAVDAFVGSVIAQHLNDVEHHRTPFSGRRKNRPELQAMFERAHIRHDAKVDTREYGAAAPQVEPELVYA